ncbi:MAG: SDR family oxidoreductase [Sphingobacteriaceae bacterium]|nr:MAG: SDR family oxidoreductase [Sphingobacteriaceae bacterium]
MDLKLTNKVAIVLAASKGLGRAIATTLSAEGAKVIICSRDEKELNQTAQEIQKLTGNEVVAIPVDVTNAEQMGQFMVKAATALGRIDILVNNAGGPPFDKFENFDEADWQKAFELNLLSFARASRLALPHLQKSNGGRIINLISISVKSVLAGSVLSTTMRMGVIGLAKMLSDEFAPYNITVNNVAPGTMLTERITKTVPKGVDAEENLKQRAKNIPLGRIGKPEELAATVAFLASEHAAYITGATIPVDGGASRAIY